MATGTTDTFLHAADLHLGAPLGSLSVGMSDSKADHLRDLAASAFDALVDTAIDRDVSFVVMAGDIYDGAEREVASQFRFHKGLARLSEAGIRTFIVHGNHDPVLGRFTPVRPLPSLVTVFDPGEVQDHIVDLESGRVARVAGVSFATQHERENLALRFRQLDPMSNVPTIGVMHANVGATSGYERYAECSPDDLMGAPIDYWALGHIHKRSVVTLPDGTRYAYPGNLQGRSSKPSECEPKGALVVPIAGGGIGIPEFVPCDTVRFVRHDIDVSQAMDLGEVIDLVTEGCESVAADADGRPVLVHVDLTGSTSLHGVITTSGSQMLTDQTRDQLGGALGDGELVRIRIRTRNGVSRQQLLDRGDLLATVLETMDRSTPSMDDLLAHLDNRVVGNTTIDVLASMAPDDDPAARSELASLIWARAEQLLIDHMEDES